VSYLVLLVAAWVERRAHESETDEGNKLKSLANSLVDRIPRKADIMKRDLKPGGPQDTKETDVCEQVVVIRDRMIGCECCEVGNEEEIKEQFDGVGFVSLRENEVLLIGAS
jgi:hypothetical protein